ncbi:GntR family transcriptional regulator [Roseiarcus fermentans]|uniref:GntR family transcriptional regulator n=1 Tax=Roseiarcus fermentans TaxID=1473586 RepID=A0A366FBQ9_9HYPH|nr:GntR family transcriptional regulator [Roseiarcus fermentans]RBP11390.1 GntR family transcriptional regulator [Roseiarcus fermentans]
MADAVRIDPAAPSGRPLYLQLVDWLRADAAGRKPGARIDSEPQLARQFGVSRFTVTRAIEILVDEGLFTRRQGLGTFVAPPRLKRAPTYLASFTEAIAAQGRSASHRLLRFGPLEASDACFPYRPGAALIGLDRLRLVDGAPTAIHHSVLEASLVERIGLTKAIAADPRFSLYRLFREAGLVMDRGVETMQARRATLKEARLLELDRDRVVVTVRRETYAADGSLIDVDDTVYDARSYAYETEIRRSVAADARLTQPKETGHASNSNDQRSLGPRIGPRNPPGRGR